MIYSHVNRKLHNSMSSEDYILRLEEFMSEQIDCLVYNHTQPSTPEPDSYLNITCNASGMTYPQYEEQEILSYLTLTAYLTTFIFGTVGNALVLYIIAYYKEVRLKSVANYYIWNLALADEMFMLSLPLFCWATYTHYWPLSGFAGTITCKLAYVARDSNKFASIFLLVALSVDRCLASFHDLTHLRTIQVGKWVCVGMWFCCIILSMPFLMYAQTVPTRNRTSCRLEWPGSSFIYMEFWVFFQLFVGLILPSTVIFTSYYILYQRLKRISARSGANKIKRPNRKMSLTVIIVALTFVLCQIPYHILQVMALQRIRTSEAYRARGEVYLPSQSVVTTFAYLNASAQVLVFISSCVNPIIYGLLNDNYRRLYRLVLCRCQKNPNLDQGLDLEGEGQGFSRTRIKFVIRFHTPRAYYRYCCGWKRQRRSRVDHIEMKAQPMAGPSATSDV